MAHLLDDIEAFLERNPQVSATRFGDEALSDRHFVRQLRAGRRVWPETEAKVRAFMSEFKPDHAGSDTTADASASHGKIGEVSTPAGATA